MSEFREFNYTDIGPKTILYLAKGLYPDSRDPIREYIQNGVDAAATETAVTVSNGSIVIENNGKGMDFAELRDTLRIAISDKDPNKDAGYKGIGIYSGLLIAQSITIRSRKDNVCVQLIVDFARMQNLIEQDYPLPEVINKTTNVAALDDFNFIDQALSGDGTQVELTGIRKELIEYYESGALTNYLTNSIPLSFDPNFYYADQINKKIDEVCNAEGYVNRSTNLHLTTAGTRCTIYRPYKFKQEQVFEPHFEIVNLGNSDGDKLLALVWGCLNQQRKVIADKHQRGFRYRLKGFAVGDAHTILPLYSRGRTHSDRYIGEIVIFSNLIEANTARSDLAPNEYRTPFHKQLKKALEKFENKSNVFQESSIANSECAKTESILATLKQSPTSDGVSELKGRMESLKNRLKQPLDNVTEDRVKQLIGKLQSEVPKLESTLKKSEQGESSTSTNSEDESEENDQPETTDSAETDNGRDAEPQRPIKARIPINDEVVTILSELYTATNGAAQVRKIQQLYDSLTTISVKQHTCLAHIGTWALWETIGFALKKNNQQKAWDYLMQTMSDNFKKSNPQKYSDMNRALSRISDDANMNKHSAIALGEDGNVLKNCMEILDDYLLFLIEKFYEHLTGSPRKKTTSLDKS